MNEKKFLVVRVVEDFRGAVGSPFRFHHLYVSDIYGNNGFSSRIGDAMKFEAAQASTIMKALETVEQIHSDIFYNEGIKVFYSIEEAQ